MNKKLKDHEEFPPPFFKTWTGWYVTVLINLTVLIAFFYWITATFD